MEDCSPSISFEETFKMCREFLKMLELCDDEKPLIDRTQEKQVHRSPDEKDYFEEKLDQLTKFTEKKSIEKEDDNTKDEVNKNESNKVEDKEENTEEKKIKKK